MRKRFLFLGFISVSILFFDSCEKEKDDQGNTNSTTSSSTTSSSTTSSTSGSTTSGNTTSTTTSGSTTSISVVPCAPTDSEVVIGTQTWTTTNLNVDKFRNGDLIPEAKTEAEWDAAADAGTPAWCYYLNSPDSGAKYGKLYNWYAVIDPRGLAPLGWHVPSDAEWTTLTNYLGGEPVAGEKMKSTCAWTNNGNGTNSSGFSGLPCGRRFDSGTTFFALGDFGGWWSSTEDGLYLSMYRSLSYGDNYVASYSFNKGEGLSVRCLKD